VAEDETDVRELVCEVLADLGLEVVAAANGDDAWAAFERRSGKIDLLLSDVAMPGGLDGIELARRTRQRRPDLPLVLCSGYIAGREQRMAELEGTVDFLLKPFRLDALETLLRKRLLI
jgi:CheY-like chemotaxis protein